MYEQTGERWTEESFLQRLEGQDVYALLLVIEEGKAQIVRGTLSSWDAANIFIDTGPRGVAMVPKHAIALLRPGEVGRL